MNQTQAPCKCIVCQFSTNISHLDSNLQLATCKMFPVAKNLLHNIRSPLCLEITAHLSNLFLLNF